MASNIISENTDNTAGQIFTVNTVFQKYSINKTRIKRSIHNEELPCIIIKNKYYIRKTDLLKWLKTLK